MRLRDISQRLLSVKSERTGVTAGQGLFCGNYVLCECVNCWGTLNAKRIYVCIRM